jgi:hypothetical protein
MYVAQTGFELDHSPDLASQLLGLQECTTKPRQQ